MLQKVTTYTIGALINTIQLALNSAWLPWYYDTLKSGNKKEMKRVSAIYISVFTALTVMFILGVPELVKLFSPKTYWSGIPLLPIIIIKAAKGEYIQFVDSDDFIDKDMLKDTLKLLEDSNADCVMTGLYLDIEQDSKISTSTQTFEYFEAENKKDIALNVLARMGGTYINSPINKLYKRNIIIENNIFMDKSIDLGEDFLFNLMYLKFCNKVIFSDKCYYHYWMKIENNLTFKFRENKLDLMYLMYKKSEEYFKLSRLSKDEYRDLNNLFIKWMYSCFIDLNNNGCNLTHKEKIRYLKNSIYKYNNIITSTNNLSLMMRLLKLSLKYPSIVLIISRMMYIIKVKYRNLLYR